MNNMEKEFIDENGEEAKVVIESGNSIQVNMGQNNYKIATEMRNKPKTLIKKRGIFTSNIGPKSEGFAGVFTLAAIIALAGVIIAFITLRF